MTVDEIFINAVESWRKNKGIGTMICPKPLDDRVPILLILQRIYSRSPTLSTIIVTQTFDDRLNLIEFLTHQEDEKNNEEFKKLIDNKYLRVFSYDFIRGGFWNSPGTLGISYNVCDFEIPIQSFIERCTFRLCIFSSLSIPDIDNRNNLSKICPILNEFKQAEIDEVRTSLPVEETWCGVEIDKTSEAFKLLEYYNKEITTTLNIFDNFDNIKFARIGNAALNISYMEYCTKVAIDNGWNDHLDMSFEYNAMIDETYNPNNLHDRACKCYEIMRLRSNLVSDYEGKLEVIYKLCEEHKDEKILIISKRGEFASKITSYLNNMFAKVVCGDYHDKLENIELKNPDGSYVLVKSGINKGKIKTIGAKAQMTRNQTLFNEDKINILSTSNAPNKELSIAVDMIIITSPLCEDIKSYLYRLSNLVINNSKVKLFSIYCKDTMEYKHICNKTLANNHIIVNKSENIDFSTNNSDFIIAD